MLQFPLVFRLALWLVMTKLNVSAQERGPIQLYIVNDSEYPISVVWLNNLRIEEDGLIPLSLGPIPAGSVATFRANPHAALELHQADDSCGTKKGMLYDPQGDCPTVFTTVKHDGQGENPTSKCD